MIRYSKEERASWPDGTRRCTDCKKVKPFSEYHAHAKAWMGVNVVCKDCRKPVTKKSWDKRSIEYKVFHRAKARAQQKGLDFDLSVEDINIPIECPVFKKPLSVGDPNWAPSIDRIDPTKGYTKDNIQIISNKANRMKSDASPEELKNFCAWILTPYIG